MMERHQRCRLVALVLIMVLGTGINAFVNPNTAARPLAPPGWTTRNPTVVQAPTTPSPISRSTNSNTELNSFMGSDGGILGIGTPELVRL